MEKLLKEKEFVVLFPEGTYYPHSMGRGKHRFIERILRVQGKMGWQGGQAIPFIPIGIRYLEKKFSAEVQVKIGRPVLSNGELDAQGFTQRILEEIARRSGLHL